MLSLRRDHQYELAAWMGIKGGALLLARRPIRSTHTPSLPSSSRAQPMTPMSAESPRNRHDWPVEGSSGYLTWRENAVTNEIPCVLQANWHHPEYSVTLFLPTKVTRTLPLQGQGRGIAAEPLLIIPVSTNSRGPYEGLQVLGSADCSRGRTA